MIDLLWPGAGSGHGAADMIALPSARVPRVLAPGAPSRAAASALTRYTAQQGARDRAAGFALAAASRAGLLARTHTPVRSSLPRSPSIDDHLSEVLGTRVRSAMALTPPRANRKPVLQVFDRRGRTLAFAKIGIDDLTRSLVDAEAHALGEIANASTSRVSVPVVLHHGTWKGLTVLANTALASGSRIRRPFPALDEAMHEVCRAGSASGAADHVSAARSAARGMTSARNQARIAEWTDLFEQVVANREAEALATGAWHGDWTEWNCATSRGRILVWDWERFATGVPVGFDKLHFVMNQAVGPRRERFAAAGAELVGSASELLAPWRLQPAEAQVTALLYILHLCLRYLRDDAPPRSVGSRIEEWAYPTVRTALGTAARRSG